MENDQVASDAADPAVSAEQQRMIEMQALQLRGTALEAALRISVPSDSADLVIAEAKLFSDYLRGITTAPAVK